METPFSVLATNYTINRDSIFFWKKVCLRKILLIHTVRNILNQTNGFFSKNLNEISGIDKKGDGRFVRFPHEKQQPDRGSKVVHEGDQGSLHAVQAYGRGRHFVIFRKNVELKKFEEENI